jgi:hypothetical protein
MLVHILMPMNRPVIMVEVGSLNPETIRGREVLGAQTLAIWLRMSGCISFYLAIYRVGEKRRKMSQALYGDGGRSEENDGPAGGPGNEAARQRVCTVNAMVGG